MNPDITVLLNHTGTEIKVSTENRLSKEELSKLNKILFDYSQEIEGTFSLTTNIDGGMIWVFFLYVLNYERYSDAYSKEEVEQVRENLVELITNNLPIPSGLIKCVGFDIN